MLDVLYSDIGKNVRIVRFDDRRVSLHVGSVWSDTYGELYQAYHCTDVWIEASDGSEVLEHVLRTKLSSNLQLMGGFPNIQTVETADFLHELTLQFTHKVRLDLSHLRLKSLRVAVADLQSLNALPNSLESLYLSGYGYEDLVPLAQLKGLNSLELSRVKLTQLNGVEAFKKLQMLELWYAPHLSDISALASCTSLHKLRLNVCKSVGSLGVVSNLRNLQEVGFDNCGKIPSLEPFLQLPSLKKMIFIENTNIEDGKIHLLADIPTLKDVWFQNRRHYDITREELKEILSSPRAQD